MLGAQHHIAIIASDYEAAKTFYIDQLGARLVREVFRPEAQDRLLLLQLGELTLELFIKPGAPDRVSYPEARGLRHLAFRVEDAEAAAAWLAQRGIETEPIREDKLFGGRFTFFRDPDGLPLEIHE